MKFSYMRWMIRSSLVYLLTGMLFGLLIYLGYRVPALAWCQRLRTVHVHLILVGGVIQMIMGVALWMFPRRPDAPHWPTRAQGWTLYALFNAGTVVRAISGPWQLTSLAGYLVGLGGIALQLAGVALFLALVFGRVRGPRLS